MSNRIPLIAGSTAAALTLVVALAATGFAPKAADATTASSTTTIEQAAAEPAVQVDAIYVAPPPPQKIVTIQEVSKTSNGDSDDAGEASGEDD